MKWLYEGKEYSLFGEDSDGIMEVLMKVSDENEDGLDYLELYRELYEVLTGMEVGDTVHLFSSWEEVTRVE